MGQKIIQIPNKPVDKPMPFKGEKFLVLGEVRLNNNVQIGTVPFNIPAKPEEMCCSPQNRKKNGIPCEKSPIIQIRQRMENGTDTLFFKQHNIIVRKNKANPTRNAAPKKGGTVFTTSLIATNEPPQNEASKKNQR